MGFQVFCKGVRQMNWQNLKINKCPKCDKSLISNFWTMYGMIHHKCGFKISEKRYQQIVSSQVNEELEEEQDYDK